MCGLVGYIGNPLNQKATFDLTTNLLRETEVRGSDATGFYATQVGDTSVDAVYYYKEPRRSTDFVLSDQWKEFGKNKTNLFIGHCRSSTEKGSERINKNNHPFLSSDKLTALVHNGFIPVPDFNKLKDQYKVKTACDSEVLLRIIEKASRYPANYVREILSHLKYDAQCLIKEVEDGQPLPNWMYRLMGVRDIFARINNGAMAVQLAERLPNGNRRLWFFRDAKRPLIGIDLRESLGQIFICSEIEIFRKALNRSEIAKEFVNENAKAIRVSEEVIWSVSLDDKQNKISIRKFGIERKKSSSSFEEDRPLLEPDVTVESDVKIISDLDVNEEPINKKKVTTPSTIPISTGSKPASANESKSNIKPESWANFNQGNNKQFKTERELTPLDADNLEGIAEDIANTVNEISETIRQLITDKKLDSKDFEEILEGFQDLNTDTKKLKNQIFGVVNPSADDSSSTATAAEIKNDLSTLDDED